MKSKLLKGTFILTIAGLVTRFLGFLYKLLLSNLLGSELLGVYQLVFPVYSICFTLYGSGLQTAISKVVSEQKATDTYSHKKTLYCGIFLSTGIAFACSFVLFFFPEQIANTFLKEPRCADSLKFLSFTFPACAISACINGFYFGQTKTTHPAIAQFIEQISRILFSLIVLFFFQKSHQTFTCEIAVFAIAVGEITAMLYNFYTILHNDCSPKNTSYSEPSKTIYSKLLSFALPLTATHLVVSFLHAMENILIPQLLCSHGFASKEALSIYGILTGMTLPLLLFPSTLFNSLSVLLLPSISKAKSEQNNTYIKKAISLSVSGSLLTGLCSSLFFLITGKFLGILLFHNELCGIYLKNLAWICPMLYLNAMFSSILNGLGKTQLTFRNTTFSLLLRIGMFLFFIPNIGIAGYFFAMLLSEFCYTIFQTFSLLSLSRKCPS